MPRYNITMSPELESLLLDFSFSFENDVPEIEPELRHAIDYLNDNKDYHAKVYNALVAEMRTLANQYGWDRFLCHFLNPDFKEELGEPTSGQLISALQASASDEGCSADLIVVGRKEYDALINYVTKFTPTI